jgi:hypothetical protein
LFDELSPPSTLGNNVPIVSQEDNYDNNNKQSTNCSSLSLSPTASSAQVQIEFSPKKSIIFSHYSSTDIDSISLEQQFDISSPLNTINSSTTLLPYSQTTPASANKILRLETSLAKHQLKFSSSKYGSLLLENNNVDDNSSEEDEKILCDDNFDEDEYRFLDIANPQFGFGIINLIGVEALHKFYRIPAANTKNTIITTEENEKKSYNVKVKLSFDDDDEKENKEEVVEKEKERSEDVSEEEEEELEERSEEEEEMKERSDDESEEEEEIEERSEDESEEEEEIQERSEQLKEEELEEQSIIPIYNQSTKDFKRNNKKRKRKSKKHNFPKMELKFGSSENLIKFEDIAFCDEEQILSKFSEMDGKEIFSNNKMFFMNISSWIMEWQKYKTLISLAVENDIKQCITKNNNNNNQCRSLISNNRNSLSSRQSFAFSFSLFQKINSILIKIGVIKKDFCDLVSSDGKNGLDLAMDYPTAGKDSLRRVADYYDDESGTFKKHTLFFNHTLEVN